MKTFHQLVFAWCLLLALGGCGGEDGAETSTPGCRLNSDCPTGEVCTEGQCEEAPACEGETCACQSDADCDDGARCSLATGACVEVECASDASCALGELCSLGSCVVDVDADRDRDGVPDGSEGSPVDNCPLTANPDQDDLDGDGTGDSCDEDDDGDGVDDGQDNCPAVDNSAQSDEDSNGVGDACEGDRDADGVLDYLDRCPTQPDPDQRDSDGDGRGDVCDGDDDNDGLPDDQDGCPVHFDPDQADADDDGVGNACDDDYDGVRVQGQVAIDPGSAALVGTDAHLDVQVHLVRGEERVSQTPDSSMSFAFGGLTEAGLYQVAADWTGWRIEPVTLELDLDRAATTVELVAVHESTLSDAVPLSGAVELLGGSGELNAPTIVRVRRSSDDGLVAVTVADPVDGVFSVLVSRQEGYRLQFAKDGYEPLSLPGVYRWDQADRRFEDEAGEPPHAALQAREARIDVRVRVMPEWLPDAERKARVRLIGAQEESREVTHDDVETFSGLDAGSYLVVAERIGFTSTQQLVRAFDDATEPITLTVDLENPAVADLDLVGVPIDDTELRALPSLRGARLSGAMIRAEDETGADLSCLDLRGAELRGADLFGASLSGSNLSGADLADARLQEAEFYPVDCDGETRSTDLTGADLADADLSRAKLGDPDQVTEPPPPADCSPSERPGVLLDGARFDGTRMRGAFLREADLTGADLSTTVLAEASLQSACLRGASLTFADLSGATLDRADLSDARMLNVVMAPAGDDAATPFSAHGSTLDRANLAGAIVDRADFGQASMVGVTLNGATLTGTSLEGATVDDSSWIGTDVGDALVMPAEQPSDCELPEGCTWGALDACAEEPEEACLVTRTSFAGASLVGAEMVGLLFYHVDLSGAVLDGANLQNTVFRQCTWAGSSFEGSDLASAALVREQISGGSLGCEVSFAGASLRGARLDDSVLTCADLRWADLTGADLNRANLYTSDLTGATLVGARADGGDLGSATLVGAALERFKLRGGLIGGADLSATHGINADLSNSHAAGLDLSMAWLPSASFREANLTVADMTGAIIKDADFAGATMKNATLLHANLAGANLTDVILGSAELSEANLDSANLTRADLSRNNANIPTRARRVNLLYANLTDANLQRLDLRGASLIEGTLLNGADLQDALTDGAVTDAYAEFSDDTVCPDGSTHADNPRCAGAWGAVCGDGVITLGVETCDEGDDAPGDGCDGACLLETTCGDGVVEGVEACDDGDATSFAARKTLDGCSVECRLEDVPAYLGVPRGGGVVVQPPLTLSGFIDADAPTWTRPNPDCSAGSEVVHLQTHRVTNTSREEVADLTIAAAWEGDGFIAVYAAPFDPDAPDPELCIAANDDDGDELHSRVTGVTIPPSGSVVVVVSSELPGETIGGYLVTVERPQ